MINHIRRRLYPVWKNEWAKKQKRKRLLRLAERTECDWLLDPNAGSGTKQILEAAVGNGIDFVQFLKDRNDLQITGVDLDDHKIVQDNYSFIQCDAAAMPFPDDRLDLIVSFGVLEHIQPVEKLCGVVREINRVSKRFGITVPSVGAILGPHTTKLLWQLRGHGKKSVSLFGLL